MLVLNEDHKAYMFYIYSNFNPATEEISDKAILFLPGITICSRKENLEHNIELIAYLLQESAVRRFENDEIEFRYSVRLLEESDISSIVAELMGGHEVRH